MSISVIWYSHVMITELPVDCKGFQVHCYYFSISTHNVFLPLNESLSSALFCVLIYHTVNGTLFWFESLNRAFLRLSKSMLLQGGGGAPSLEPQKVWFYVRLFIAKPYIHVKFICTIRRQIVGAEIGLQSCLTWLMSFTVRPSHTRKKKPRVHWAVKFICFFFLLAHQPRVGQGLHIHSRSHTTTYRIQ